MATAAIIGIVVAEIRGSKTRDSSIIEEIMTKVVLSHLLINIQEIPLSGDILK